MSTWYVLGAGAIGGLWAWRLQNAGFPVILLGRQRATRRLLIQAGPVQQQADFEEFPLQAPPSPITQLLITTKAPDTRAAIQQLAPAIRPDARLILLQNGLGVREEILVELPSVLLLNAITTEGVYRRSRNELVLAGPGDCDIGCLASAQQALAQQLVSGLQAAKLPLRWAPDMALKLWQKLAINCAINPLTALYDCRNGELLNSAAARQQMRAVSHELAAVMRAQGLPTQGDELYARALQVAAATAANTSSMRADVQQGRSTEIAYMNGYIVREAQRLGLSAPANAQLYHAVLARHPDQQP